MIRDTLEFVIPFVSTIIGLIVGIFLLILLYDATFGAWSCEAFTAASSLKTNYTISGGCYVTMKDGTTLPQKAAIEIIKRQYATKHDIKLDIKKDEE